MSLASRAVKYAHSWVDWGMEWAKLIEKREVGWLTVDRKTGEYKREQQPLKEKLRLLILFNPLMELLDNTWFWRHHLHAKTDPLEKRMEDPKTKSQIRPFVEFFRINMQEFTPSDIDAYGSFQDFFIRHHTAESRPIHAADDPTIAVCSADARVVVYDRVSIAQKTWIKGHHFSLTALVGSKAPDDQAAQEAVKFADGAIASFRLSPQDYHRYHSPVTGMVRWYKELDGEYYQVDPLALRSPIDILSRNARSVVCIETKEFGDVLFVAIGATDVGSVKLSEKAKAPGASVKKGDEMGIFEFGGSSIVVAFEQGRIQFDEDLVSVSKRAVMMDVEVGMSMGKATKPGV